MKCAIAVIAVLSYLTVLPWFIVDYGINNNIRAFDNGAPFAEVYISFVCPWVVCNFVLLFLSSCAYNAYCESKK